MYCTRKLTADLAISMRIDRGRRKQSVCGRNKGEPCTYKVSAVLRQLNRDLHVSIGPLLGVIFGGLCEARRNLERFLMTCVGEFSGF